MQNEPLLAGMAVHVQLANAPVQSADTLHLVVDAQATVGAAAASTCRMQPGVLSIFLKRIVPTRTAMAILHGCASESEWESCLWSV